MKKSELERIIKEEVHNILNEGNVFPMWEDGEVEESRMVTGAQAQSERQYLNQLIDKLKTNDILRVYIEKGEQSRFAIPHDPDKQGNHPYLILADEISKNINKPKEEVIKGLENIGVLKKKDKDLASSPIVYSSKSGLDNFSELIGDLLFKELGLDVSDNELNESIKHFQKLAGIITEEYGVSKEAKSNDYYEKGMMSEDETNNFTLKFIKDFETPLDFKREGWGKIIMRDVISIAKAAGEQGLTINDLFKHVKFKHVTEMKPNILNWIDQLVQDGYLSKA